MAIEKLKTKFFVGSWINNVKEFFTKINEIIDYLNGTGSVGAGSYKKYIANLTQSGTSAPTVKILENTIGNIVFTYDSTGYYIGTLTGAFTTANKCCFFVSKQFPVGDTGGLVINIDISMNRDDANSFHIASESAGTVANGVLNNTTIEIRVYN